jgi:hypothetical protein
MIRQPAVRRSTRGLKKASTYSAPPPVGGWNARDPLAVMKETDAVALENWYPMASDVELRKGVANWVTGLPTPPLSLLSWNGSASNKMFAATASAIYDVTVTGAVGASVASCTNGRFSHTNFSTVGGHYLIAVNGVDKLKLYDGTTWLAIDGTSTPAITGLATTTLNYVAVIKRRLWFIPNGSTSAWYLPTAAVGGALTEFPLGQIFDLGGRLVAIGAWTIDGGNGSDDYTVFVSSEGQVAVYKGSDPSDATTFTKVGCYYVGEPIGSNCLAQYGGDLLLLCQNGLYPLSKALQSATIDRAQSLTAKIDTAFTEAASSYGANAGWSVAVFPRGSFVLVNVPIAAGYSEQYVMNSITGAWCKFKNIFANDWIVSGQQLYVASDTKIGLAWTGTSDFGAPIYGMARQAYTYLNRRGAQKHLKLCRPILATNGALSVSLSLSTDFSEKVANSAPAVSASTTSLWDDDTSLWDDVDWAEDFEMNSSWGSIEAFPFYAAALSLQVAASDATIKWSATDYVYELGGPL